MNKTAQNLTWNCLPLEVKKEVQRQYQIATNAKEHFTKCTLEYLFGLHNLTSDAEGEEMLTVSRKRVQELYKDYCAERDKEEPGSNRSSLGGRIAMLEELFGSKCRPDNVATSEPNVDSLEPNVESLEQKPPEPKFKVGDKVKDISNPHDGGIYKIDNITKSSDRFIYHIQGLIGKSNVKESDLEPYTEPNAGTRQEQHVPKTAESGTYPNLSQETANCDKQFDRILKDSFSKERRLNIAAQFMSAMMSNPSVFHSRLNSEEEDFIIYGSLEFADTLIAEALKGGRNGED